MYFQHKLRQLDREDHREELLYLWPLRIVIVLAIVLGLVAFLLAGCSPARIDKSDASTNVMPGNAVMPTPNVDFDFDRIKKQKPKWRKAKTSAPATK